MHLRSVISHLILGLGAIAIWALTAEVCAQTPRAHLPDEDARLLERAAETVDRAPDDALELIEPYISNAPSYSDRQVSQAYWIKTRALTHKTEYDAALIAGETALNYAPADALLLRSDILHIMSTALARSNRTRRAFDLGQEALSLREELGDVSGQAASLAVLAEIYSDVGQHERSSQHYEAALSKARESNDPYLIVVALNNYAFSLLFRNRAQQSLEMLLEAQSLAKSIDNPRLAAFVNQNTGHALVRLGRFDEAEPYVRAASLYAMQNAQRELLTGVFLTLARIEMGRSAYAEARRHAMTALLHAEDINYVERISDLELLLSRIAFAEGDLSRAYNHLQNHVEHLSALSASATSRSASLFAAHEELLEQKRQLDISRKEAEISGLEAARARAVRNGAVLVTCLLALMLAGAFWFLREKIQAKRALERKNKALSEAYVELERANSAKSHFLSVVSHELRTPLNSVIGFSDMIRNEKLGPVGRPDYAVFARHINEQGVRLLRMVQDILLVTEAESGRLVIKGDVHQDAEIIDLALQSISAHDENAPDRIIRSDANETASLNCDGALMSRAVAHLLENALKFSDGRVSVETVADPQTGWRLTIKDEGPGFDHDQTDALLRPFRQADETRARAHEGAGLGLPVARLIAEHHGGALEVGPEAEDSPQTGACVTISLPPECVVAECATACNAATM